MKAAGLPGNEAARVRQFAVSLLAAWESMRVTKRYRTSLAARCFSRVYIWAHCFLMGARLGSRF